MLARFTTHPVPRNCTEVSCETAREVCLLGGTCCTDFRHVFRVRVYVCMRARRAKERNERAERGYNVRLSCNPQISSVAPAPRRATNDESVPLISVIRFRRSRVPGPRRETEIELEN